MAYTFASFAMSASMVAESQTVTRFDSLTGLLILPAACQRQMVDSETPRRSAICAALQYRIVLLRKSAFAVYLRSNA